MRDISGLTVAITGASAGIGEATARAVVAEGASVVLGARRVDRLEALAAELGSSAAIVEMDVREPGDSQRLVQEAYSRFGRLDALVANAGIGAYGGIMDLDRREAEDDDGHQRGRHGVADPRCRAGIRGARWRRCRHRGVGCRHSRER